MCVCVRLQAHPVFFFHVRQPEQCLSVYLCLCVCLEEGRRTESGTEARREWLYINARKGIAKKCQRCHVRPANIHQVAVSHLKSNTSADLGVQFAMRGMEVGALDRQTFGGKSWKRAGHAANLATWLAPTWEELHSSQTFSFWSPRWRKDVGDASSPVVVGDFHEKQKSHFLTHQFTERGPEATCQNSWGELKKRKLDLTIDFTIDWLLPICYFYSSWCDYA